MASGSNGEEPRSAFCKEHPLLENHILSSPAERRCKPRLNGISCAASHAFGAHSIRVADKERGCRCGLSS